MILNEEAIKAREARIAALRKRYNELREFMRKNSWNRKHTAGAKLRELGFSRIPGLHDRVKRARPLTPTQFYRVSPPV